jgi:4-carboxymuconolactone decarboxylase
LPSSLASSHTDPTRRGTNAETSQQNQDGCLIGPFNPILYSPGISTAFMDLHDAEEAHTSIDEQVRQAVILAVGSVWGTDYERYAHAVAARKAGLSDDAIAALSAGRTPANLSEPALIAVNFAHELSAQHAVSDDTYRAVVGAFGEKGIVDLTFLIGIYHIVCGLLNVVQAPVPE